MDSLELKIRAKVARWIDKLEECGPSLPRPYADIVKGKIRELRVIFASRQYRFLYFFYDKNIIITHGFMKKTDRVPDNEIKKAQDIMHNLEERLQKGEAVL